MSSTYGKQVGHWRVSKAVIGSGTTSTVHLASHCAIPTLRAAVKIVSRTGLLLKADGDPTALHLADAVIHREVLLMKLASHERIIKLYDFVRRGDLVYMILEHAPNNTLFDLFRSYSSFFPTSLVTHLFSQLMHGLAHLHSLHIVHRDIKLENIFLFGPDVKDVFQPDSTQARIHKYKHFLPKPKHTPAHTRNSAPPSYTDFGLKLGDFGLSHTQSPSTLSTVFHGSPHYQAPELWARVPHRVFPTDMWSAGVVLFALVGRRLPFEVPELEEWACVFSEHCCDELHVENKHTHAHEKDAEKERVDCPIPRAGSPYHMPYDHVGIMSPAIDHLLQRLFALDPAMRPTAGEVLAEPLFSGTECASSSGDVSVLQGSKDRGRGHLTPPHHIQADTYDSRNLYDLATLCTAPSTHVPRATFHNSSLERRVRRRLESGEECIEKVWAGRLAAWEGEEEIGVDEKEKNALGKEKEQREKGVENGRRVKWEERRKRWGQSLGKIKGADVRGHLASFGHLGRSEPRGKAEKAVARPEHEDRGETHLSVSKTRLASLSFRSLRMKTVHMPFETKLSRPTTHTAPPLDSTAASHNDATSSPQLSPSPSKPKISFRALRIKTSDREDIQSSAQTPHSLAQTPAPSTLQTPLAPHAVRRDAAIIRSRHETALALQARHDALLRQAFELGFGTQDLRAFADEAGRIVRDAREGTRNCDNWVDGGTKMNGSSSTATTLLLENRGRGQKCSVKADVPVVKVVAMGVGRPERGLNMAVDVTFDMEFETDLRWI